MERTKVLELVEQQLDYENSTRNPYVSTNEGIRFVTRAMLDLRQEAYNVGLKFNKERMTQTAIKLSALSIKFIVDLT